MVGKSEQKYSPRKIIIEDEEDNECKTKSNELEKEINVKKEIEDIDVSKPKRKKAKKSLTIVENEIYLSNDITPTTRRIRKKNLANSTLRHKSLKSTGDKFSRSSSIADFKRGLTPLQKLQKEVEKRKELTNSLNSNSDLTNSIELYNQNKKKEDEKEKLKKKKKKNRKQLQHFHTGLSCNGSLVVLESDKALKSRDEDIIQTRKLAGALMQYSQIIKNEDEYSILASSLQHTAEYLDISSELFSSWCRNLEKRVIIPTKNLQQISDDENGKKLKIYDVNELINSLIGFANVYTNFCRVGSDNMKQSLNELIENRSIVAFDNDDLFINSLEIGKKCIVPFENISIHGMYQKKGAIRHNWKYRWFVLYFNYLLYFNNKQDSILKGYISLNNAIISTGTHKKHNYVLNIYSSSRNYQISFKDKDTLLNWFELVKANVIKHPICTKKSKIYLVEPKITQLLSPTDKNYKPPQKLDLFLRQDMFSRHWRDFRAKDPNMIQWITQEDNLRDLIVFSLMYVPDVTNEEIEELEKTISKSCETTTKNTGKISKTLSTLGIKKENQYIPSSEELKQSNNALLFKTANSAFTVFVACEQMADAFVKKDSLMNILFNFMKDEKPPVHPRRFHAFTELIIHLLRHRSNEVFIFLRNNQNILDELLNHIENEHCLRLLLELWTYTQSEEKVYILNQLGIISLTKFYTCKTLSEQEIDNLTIFIRELIRRHRLLTMNPETAMILSKMKDVESLTSLGKRITVNIEEGLKLIDKLDNVSNYIKNDDNNNNDKKITSPKKRQEKKEEEEEKKEEEADEILSKARSRRNSEIRREWIDINYIELMEENNDDNNDDDTNDKSKSLVLKNPPKKPLPKLPQQPSRDHLNVKAPGFMESKTAPFVTALKNINFIKFLISNSLQYENQQLFERSTELIISILKITRSKESDILIGETRDEFVQKAPHIIITEIVSKFPFFAQLLRIQKDSLSKSKNSTSNDGDNEKQIYTLPNLGLFKYNLIRIIRYVIDCGFLYIDRNFIDSKLCSRCITIMFSYPKHSVMLSVMDELLTIIFTRSIHEDLAVKILKKYKLPQKIIKSVCESRKLELSLPIAAYLTNLADTISANKAAKKILRKNREWIEFLADYVFPTFVSQYIDDDTVPIRNDEKSKQEAEKWKKRWEEFNFLISV